MGAAFEWFHSNVNLWFFGLYCFGLFWAVGLGLVEKLSKVVVIPAGFRVLFAILSAGLLGYLTFWVYLLNRWPGIALSLAVAVFGLSRLRRAHRTRLWRELVDWEKQSLLLCLFLCLFFQILNLHLNPLDSGVGNSSHLLMSEMPHDNVIPRMFAQKLFHGVDPRDMGASWKSSDRPPLQAGVCLAFGLLGELLHMPMHIYESLGVLLQSLWIFPVFFFFSPSFQNRFALAKPSEGRKWESGEMAFKVVAASALSGFVFFNSLYVWPKLLAASLGLMGALLLLIRDKDHTLWCASAVAFALAYLSHGGAAFGILPVILLWPVFGRVRPVRGFMWGALFGIVLLGAWMAYQKLYDPPGDRLLRMHLAEDQQGISLWSAITESYGRLSFQSWWERKWWNLRFLLPTQHWLVFPWQVSADSAAALRQDSFLRVFVTPGLFLIGWVAVFFRPKPRNSKILFSALGLSGLYTLVGLLVWVFLLFHPSGTSIHAGYYGFPLLLVVVSAAASALAGPWIYWPLMALHSSSFALIWVVYSPATRSPSGIAFLFLNSVLLSVLAVRIAVVGSKRHRPGDVVEMRRIS